MSNEIPNAELIRAVLDGKQGQVFIDGEWCNSPADEFIAQCVGRRKTVRLKPDERTMIRVNGVLLPKHETKKPAYGQIYYVPTACANPMRMQPYFWDDWRGTEADNNWFDSGLVYLNADDAAARARAMLRWEDA